MNKNTITVGADPEFFLTHGDHFVSAHDIVPGRKDEPFKLKHGAIQADGTAVEFNIDPASSSEEFVHNINEVLEQVRKLVPLKYSFQFLPSVEYEPKYFKRIPYEAKLLGCDPDFNAYAHGEMNHPPEEVGTMRTGAGHIHAGWDQNLDVYDEHHLLECCDVVQALDRHIGGRQDIWDNDKKRQQMYGKPGAFRPKPYGVEWRSLSNAWLNYPVLWPWLFDSVQAVVEGVKYGISVDHLPRFPFNVTNVQEAA